MSFVRRAYDSQVDDVVPKGDLSNGNIILSNSNCIYLLDTRLKIKTKYKFEDNINIDDVIIDNDHIGVIYSTKYPHRRVSCFILLNHNLEAVTRVFPISSFCAPAKLTEHYLFVSIGPTLLAYEISTGKEYEVYNGTYYIQKIIAADNKLAIGITNENNSQVDNKVITFQIERNGRFDIKSQKNNAIPYLIIDNCLFYYDRQQKGVFIEDLTDENHRRQISKILPWDMAVLSNGKEIILIEAIDKPYTSWAHTDMFDFYVTYEPNLYFARQVSLDGNDEMTTQDVRQGLEISRQSIITKDGRLISQTGNKLNLKEYQFDVSRHPLEANVQQTIDQALIPNNVPKVMTQIISQYHHNDLPFTKNLFFSSNLAQVNVRETTCIDSEINMRCCVIL